MIWRDFEAAAPDLARLGRARLEGPGVAVLGALRSNGAPRIDPVSVYVAEGHLMFGVMRSHKRADLRRDPRCAIHSAISDPEGTDGEFKAHGRAVLVTDPALRKAPAGAWWPSFPPEAADVYSLDLESAVFMHWDWAAGEVSVDRWSASSGVTHSRRGYP